MTLQAIGSFWANLQMARIFFVARAHEYWRDLARKRSRICLIWVMPNFSVHMVIELDDDSRA